MTKIAVYPGTFDPITNGHIDICERAARLFDEIVLAVAVDTAKQTFFDLQTRLSLAQTVFADMPSVVVEPFDGLLVDFARNRGAQVILRGLRAVSDFEYEFQLAGMNRSLDKDIETLFLTPADQYAFLSSSLVREVAMLGGDVSRFVHPEVDKALARRRP
ncbi:pantetheine-phosphate adenylyltransferase [Kaarinaea lacus]